MKVAFGPALPVGTAGEREYLDVWLTRLATAQEILAALVLSAPGDLAPCEAGFVPNNVPSLTAALTIAEYRVEIDGEEISQNGVQAALARVLSAGELAVESKGKHKVFDLARAVPKDVRVTGRHGGVGVDLAVRMGPQGSLRPESLIRSALSSAHITVAALRTTRLDTFVEDDEGVWSRPV
jgi:radical SAM-linked protein